MKIEHAEALLREKKASETKYMAKIGGLEAALLNAKRNGDSVTERLTRELASS